MERDDVSDVLRAARFLIPCLLLPVLAVARPGMGDSPPFPVDTIAPAVTVAFPGRDVILHAGTAVVFTWQREVQQDDPAELTDTAVVLAGSVPLDSVTVVGHPGTVVEWGWVPPEISAGDCRLVIRSRDRFGNTATAASEAFSIIPSSTGGPGPVLPYRLAAPRPNPFNPSTGIRFSLPEPTEVRLSVLDAQGRRLALLLQELLPAGDHTVRWDGRDTAGRRLSGGVYLLCLEAAGRPALSRKVVLLP